MRSAAHRVTTLDPATPATIETPGHAVSGEREPATDRLGRFRLLRRLGVGGMGVVHAAYDAQLDRVVALKTLRADRDGADGVARFIREGQALARLSHPNVVPIYEVGAAGGQVFLAMEYIRGHTLRDVLTGLPEPGRVAAVVDLMLQAGRGLAAIHSAGLVHRDFKPDNVMVGDDGRVRVMDLGLVRATDEAEAPCDSPTLTDWTSPLTIAGAVLGTPAYMAPEQQTLGPADARSDIFSFCATFHEALYGVLPGMTPPLASAAAVVPPWLRALVLRGLCVDPQARWPSMEVLLAQLVADPVARRRQRLRRLGLGLVVSGLAVAGTIGYFHLQRQLARERSEALAAEHLANIAAAPGEEPDDAAFAAFVEDRAHQGTRALLRAWRERGDRRRATQDVSGALDAYARAYAEASQPSDLQATMRGIAAVYLDAWDTPALGRVVQALPLDPADPDDHHLFMTTALRRRDLAGAAAWLAAAPVTDATAGLRPLIAALARSHPLGVEGNAATVLPATGRMRLAVVDHSDHEVALFDQDLTLQRTWTLDTPIYPLPNSPWALRNDPEFATVVDIRAPEIPTARFATAHDVRPLAALDHVGRSALYFRRVWPERGFEVVDPEGGTPRAAHPASDATSSDIEAIMAADLDGDGVEEVVTAFGAFRAYDLRVFHRDPHGALELIARQTFGRITALAPLRRPNGELVVAIATQGTTDPERFPGPPHSGLAPGIHLLRWTGAGFEPRAFAPLAATSLDAVKSWMLVADLDGDGVDELIMPAAHGANTVDGDEPNTHTLIVRQMADGGLQSLVLGHTYPLAVGQLDQDPAQELVVRTEHDHTVHVLGLGDASLEPVPLLAHAVTPPPPALRDADLQARWRRADDLTAIGLPRPAAEVLRDAAVFLEDSTLRRWFRDRASALFALAGDLHRALEWSEVGLGVPELAASTLSRRIDLLEAMGRYQEAAAAATMLREHGGPHASVATATLRRLGPLLDPTNALELRFDRPLAPGWRVEQPAALHRELGAGVLRVETVGDQPRLAALPLSWSGGPLVLEVELDVLHAEYNTSFSVALVDARGEPVMAVTIGGGGHRTRAQRHHRVGCIPVGHSVKTLSFRYFDSAAARHRVLLRLAYSPEQGRSECVIEDAGVRSERRFHAPLRPEPGPLELVIGSLDPHASPHQIVAELRQISVHGAHPSPGSADNSPEASVARMLVEGDPQAALRLLSASGNPPSDRSAMLRLIASDASYSLDPALAATVLATRTDPELIALLRARPQLVWRAHQALGARFVPLLAQAWCGLLRHHGDDPVLQRLILAQLRGLGGLEATTPAAQEALAQLLSARGMLYVAIDQPQRAREDLTAALALVTAASGSNSSDLAATLHLTLARLFVASDPQAARTHARQMLASDPAPELAWEQLLVDPGLAALLADDLASPSRLDPGAARAN